MLKLSEALSDTPIVSLRTGGQVGTAIEPIINPNNLKVEGWYAEDKYSKKQLVLLAQDIREVLPQGFAVNDHDVLTEPVELIRLKEVLGYNFRLIGKYVTTENKNKVGKVSDYAVDIKSMFVQKIYASQSIIKNFSGTSVSIDRSQIIEITDRRIVVEEPTEKAEGKAASPVPAA